MSTVTQTPLTCSSHVSSVEFQPPSCQTSPQTSSFAQVGSIQTNQISESYTFKRLNTVDGAWGYRELETCHVASRAPGELFIIQFNITIVTTCKKNIRTYIGGYRVSKPSQMYSKRDIMSHQEVTHSIWGKRGLKTCRVASRPPGVFFII